MRIEWRKTVDQGQAKQFTGAFANQNIMCKLRDEATVGFLVAEFDAQGSRYARMFVKAPKVLRRFWASSRTRCTRMAG